MIFNIKVNEDKTVEHSEIIVNQFENEIDQLEFVLPFSDFSYVSVLKSPSNKKLEIPIVNNKLIIDKSITSTPGEWKMIVVGTKDSKCFVSNQILLKSCRNFLALSSVQEIDKNIELLYAELEETLRILKDKGLEEISSLVEMSETLNSLQLNVEGIYGDLRDLSDKVDKIPTNDYTSDLGEIKGLLTDANSIADAIL